MLTVDCPCDQSSNDPNQMAESAAEHGRRAATRATIELEDDDRSLGADEDSPCAIGRGLRLSVVQLRVEALPADDRPEMVVFDEKWRQRTNGTKRRMPISRPSTSLQRIRPGALHHSICISAASTASTDSHSD